MDEEIDFTDGGLFPDIVPEVSIPTPGSLAGSMMQPVGEEEARGERSRENLEQAMAGGDVDPYAQYTDEHVDFPETERGTVAVDENLIDPPDIAGGGEDGFVDTDSNREHGDSED